MADTLLAAAWLLGDLIAVLALQPLFSAAPLPLVDIVVVLHLGLIVLIPCDLFIRGVLSTS